MLKNKHLITALIVAPILSIIAYFTVDKMVSEQPHKAQSGQSYPLVALPNCRYPSGLCRLKNAEFQLEIFTDSSLQTDTIKQTISGSHIMKVHIQSKHPLQGIKIALVNDKNSDAQPISMEKTDQNGLKWQTDLSIPSSESNSFRIAASADDTLYFGETGLAFIKGQTD